MADAVVLGARFDSPLEGTELLKIAEESVARIAMRFRDEELGHGSCFAYKQVVSGGRSKIYFLTNLHNFVLGLPQAYRLSLYVARESAAGGSEAGARPGFFVTWRGEFHEVSSIIAAKGAFTGGIPRWFQDFAIFSIEVEASESFRMFAVPTGDESARGGERIFALGYPDDTDLGITDGIVSKVYGENAHHGDADYAWQIQHNLLINPGNSGGPTVNQHGVAVGMSTWKKTNVEGICFSVNVSHLFSICREPDQIEEVSLIDTLECFRRRAQEEARFGN